MTTMHIQDISHKRFVPSKYTPNSYRIFCEDIGNESVENESKYSSQASKIYSEPLIIPTQAIEDRNFPHAGRGAEFLRENAHTLNEPVNRISSKNVDKESEKRWWEWNTPQGEDPNWKSKKRSTSLSGQRNREQQNGILNQNDVVDPSNFQTTYQKEHGYIKNSSDARLGKVNNDFSSAQRHTYNPNNSHAVGIVPINDLNSFSKENEQQRVFVDRVSFEQAYDSRNDNNYPMRGRRHGAFVVEQAEPRSALGTKNRPEPNKNISVWDLMHPQESPAGIVPPKTQVFQKPPSGKSNNQESLRNQRRDPIGYFEDSKYGGSLGSNLPRTNSFSNMNNYQQQQQQQSQDMPPQPLTNGNGPLYQPSWDSNNNINLSSTNLRQLSGNNHSASSFKQPLPSQHAHEPNDLLDNAMRPLMVNGHRN